MVGKDSSEFNDIDVDLKEFMNNSIRSQQYLDQEIKGLRKQLIHMRSEIDYMKQQVSQVASRWY